MAAMLERSVLAEALYAQATLHSIGDAVISADVAGNVTYLNPVSPSAAGSAQDHRQSRGGYEPSARIQEPRADESR